MPRLENVSEEGGETDPFIALPQSKKAAPAAFADQSSSGRVVWPWSSVDPFHLPRVAWLSVVLCSIVGSFWLLDSLKDTVFATLVGLEHQPVAKVLSVITTLIVVMYYNSLLDRFGAPTVSFGLVGLLF
jgi:ATP/ADP translocase